MNVIPILPRQKEDCSKFQVSLDYIVKLCVKPKRPLPQSPVLKDLVLNTIVFRSRIFWKVGGS